MLKAYKYRLYPTNEQKTLLDKHFGCVRLIYNTALLFRQYCWQAREAVTYHKTAAELTELKKEYLFLKEVNSQSLQHALKHLDAGYKNFFSRRADFPKFKSKHSKQAFHCPQKVYVCDKGILIPKFKDPIKTIFDRKHKGVIRSMTVTKTPTGKYFVSVLTETNQAIPKPKPINNTTTIGIDLGIKNFVVTSNGEKYDNPKYLQNSLVKLKYEQRLLSRKTKGSKRRNKQRLRVAKLHEKVANQRQDFLHKLSTQITNGFDTICVETLQVKNMVKNRKLSRVISDVGWGTFGTMLKYKAQAKGKNIIAIGTFEPSSKTCSQCGHKNNDLTLAEREWQCGGCKTMLDRDINAAVNIKQIGLKNWRTERALQDTEVLPLPCGKRKRKQAVEVLKVQSNMLQIAS